MRKPESCRAGNSKESRWRAPLVLRPKALLMDEPQSNLDQDLNQRLRKEILQLHEALGFTLVCVAHDREESAELGTRVVFMKSGRIELEMMDI